MAKTKTPYKSLNVRLNTSTAEWFEKYCDTVGWSKTTGVERMILFFKEYHVIEQKIETHEAKTQE